MSFALAAVSILLLLAGYLVPYISSVGVIVLCTVGSILLLCMVLICFWTSYREKQYVPACLAAVWVVLLFAAKKGDLVERLDFWVHQDSRKAVVQMVRAEIPSGFSEGLYELPEDYCNNRISQSNEVWVCQGEQGMVLYFYYYRGILDASSGFAYAEGNEALEGTDLKVVADLGDGWYICNTE